VIRRARELGDVPILVLSARSAVGDRILGLTEGADDYLPKPFSPAELVVRVRTILRRVERRQGSVGPGVVLVVGDLVLDPARHAVGDPGHPAGDHRRRDRRLRRNLVSHAHGKPIPQRTSSPPLPPRTAKTKVVALRCASLDTNRDD
jgi:DNA-binding response OmpR family regulator